MKKRVFAFILASAMTFGASACGKTEKEPEKEAQAVVNEKDSETAEKEEIEEIPPEEIKGDRPADYYENMPYGVYKSNMFAREVHIKENGVFEDYMGHGEASFEPEIGTWEQTQIDMGNEMLADGLILYRDGKEYMTMIWDGDRFYIESDANEGMVEYMERVEQGEEISSDGSEKMPFEASPEECIVGSWALRSRVNCDVAAYEVYEDGTWEAFGTNEETVSSGIWTLSSLGDYAYLFFEDDGTVYDEISIYTRDGDVILNSVRESNDFYRDKA